MLVDPDKRFVIKY